MSKDTINNKFKNFLYGFISFVILFVLLFALLFGIVYFAMNDTQILILIIFGLICLVILAFFVYALTDIGGDIRKKVNEIESKK